MYEVTVSTPSQHKHLLEYVHKSMHGYIKKVGGTCVNLSQKCRSYFSLACNDTFSFQSQRLLRECVSSALAVGYKNIFMRSLLDVANGNFYQNILVDTMCVFDQQYDVAMVSNVVDTTKDLYLDGYYNFRMHDIKRRWENVVNMVLENNYVLTDNELILEFLQYLLQSSDAKTKQITICLEDSGYTLYDVKGNVLQNISILSPTSTKEEQAIVNAIYLNPQKLIVYYAKQPSQEFCHVAKTLFDVQFVKVR
ncbi:MAG: hypothetical protein IJX23_00525 [Clostridia bacterium]|nr:hypothetical protein [Clostridia bacterium]